MKCTNFINTVVHVFPHYIFFSSTGIFWHATRILRHSPSLLLFGCLYKNLKALCLKISAANVLICILSIPKENDLHMRSALEVWNGWKKRIKYSWAMWIQDGKMQSLSKSDRFDLKLDAFAINNYVINRWICQFTFFGTFI